MLMYKLEVKLKQHTPLIHFQWEQEGATLRASEVKPKLDRFILEKLVEKKEGDSKEDCYNKGLKIAKTNGWLIGESKALDYKMRIVVNNKNNKPVESLVTARYISETTIVNNKPKEVEIYSGTSYFAQEEENIGRDPKSVLQKNIDKTYNFNVDKWKEIDKKGLEWKEIILSITSFYDDLGTSIEGVLREFFICTNFGTRSTKGFGSFEVIEKKEENGYEGWKLLEAERKEILQKNFDFVYEKVVQGNALAKIKEDYQLIKSGINNPFDPDAYKKSKLFLFGVKKGGVRWEKRLLKKIIDKNDLYNKNREKVKLYYKIDPITGEEDDKGRKVSKQTNNWGPDNYQYEFLRAALGLTEQYEFLLTKEGERKIDYSDKIIVKVVNVDKEKIERYKSPLFFKVIDKVIYLAGNDKSLQGDFQFEIFVKSNPNKKILHKPEQGIDLQLSVPKEFSLCDFMTFVMNEPEFTGRYETLKNIKDAKIQLYHHRADH